VVISVACGLITRLEWANPATGEREMFFQPDEGDFSAASVRDRGVGTSPQIAVVHSTGTTPPEVKVGSSESLSAVSIHHENLSEYTFGEQEAFTWTAPDGLELD